MSSSRLRARVGLAAASAALVAAALALWGTGRGALVVYCAHDRVYSERMLERFTEETGVAVSPRFDTEATKSLGLVEQIAREASAPRCDVFWNNEVLGTMDLARRGLLAPLGDSAERIPEQYRDPGGLWAGFGARMRVWIVNTDKLPPTREAVRTAIAGDLSRVAIARPLFGTTLTHYCVLADLMGMDALKRWHRDWRSRGVREVPGNSAVKDLVAEGVCDVGLTDTDDFFLAKDEGKPVAMVPFRTGDVGAGSTNGSRPPDRVILIPNTVAIVKGTRRPGDAKRLAAWLVSAEAELALARSRARQIPLGPVDAAALPTEVAELAALASNGYPLGGLLPARDACIEWLKAER